MIRRLAIFAATLAALAGFGAAQAHHSSSMFEISAPIWIKGRVVVFEAVNPHPTMLLELRGDDGELRQWTVEGPNLRRLGRMREQPEVGDVIEVCGFALKAEFRTRSAATDPYGKSPGFVHGHMLLMPDGHWELFGAYGSLSGCMQSADYGIDTWVDFLDHADPSVRELWCGQRRTAVERGLGNAIYPRELAEQVNARMASPCE